MGEVEKLMSKFLEGKTSLGDEKELRNKLQSGVSDDFEAELALDHLVVSNGLLTLSDDFDSRLLEKLEESNPIKKSRLLWPVVTGIAASLLLVATYFGLNSNNFETVATAGGNFQIKLADGSTITLNKNSKLQYPKEFDDDTRDVVLFGEAFFEISPDPNKPFIVKSGNSTTTVLGTSFNIRNYEDDDHIEVTVLTGKVSFSSKSNSELLLKGDRAALSKISNTIEKKSNQMKGNITSWKSKKLNFNDQLLGEVITDLERYFDISIEVKNRELLQCHFKGSFQNADMPEILRTLEYVFGISYEKQGKSYILSGKGCSE
jgi:ferric-dicitrate binding protein FerR (iron transport regulator)